MTPPISIDGTDITGATIDGQDVEEITVDGQTVFSAGPPSTPVTDLAINRWLVQPSDGPNTIEDVAGNSDATINGGSIVSDSDHIGGAKYDRSGTDYVDANRDADFGLSEIGVAFTIEYQNTNLDIGYIFGTYPGSGSASSDFLCWFNPLDGKIQYGVGGEFLTIENVTFTPPIQRAIYSIDNNGMKIFLDGNLVDSNNETISNYSFNEEIYWGNNTNLDNKDDFAMSDVTIFNGSITTQDAVDDFNAQPYS